MFSLLIVLLCVRFGGAQQSVAVANAAVPPLIPFSGVATDESGSALAGEVNMTFSLYGVPQGGTPLWTETQNSIQLDSTGHYSVQLGVTQSNGVPTYLFTTTEARWLGVRIAGQQEQPRVLLLSVPYALKAGDAATIGGLPPSAFMLAIPSASAPALPTSSAGQDLPPTGTDVTGMGTAGFIPLWTSTSNIANSVMFQTGTGSTAKVGINNSAPASTLDVKGTATFRGTTTLAGPLTLPATGAATASAGKTSQPTTLAASAFNSTSGMAVNQTFQWQAEPANNDTSAPSGTLNLLFGSGTAKPAETGLNIASDGEINFAAGQTFPGTGTLTGITTAAGSGLIGGGTSGTLTMGLLTSCSSGQVLLWNGTAWVCATAGTGTVSTVASGTGLLGGPITSSGTLAIDPTVVPQLSAANTFAGNQTVTGNVISTAGYEIQFAGKNYLFDYGSPYGGSGLGNSYLGFAGNTTTTGVDNVGAGWSALIGNGTGDYNTAVGTYSLFTNSSGEQNTAVGSSALAANGGGSGSTGNANTAVGFESAYDNTTGFNNAAVGALSLYNNTTGSYDTAVGESALNANTTGTYNTAIGYQAGPSSAALTNTTAVGANAFVSESNALVLGGVGASAVKVGIGTASPAYTLDAVGTIRSSTGGFMFPDGTIQTTAASGSGTITGVTAGTGLSGGGTSGNITLSINTAAIPQLNTANTFTGTITAGTASGSTAGVLGLSNATSGQAYGVGGLSSSSSGYGVEGLNTSSAGIGVYGAGFTGTLGTTGSPSGIGVKGSATSTTGSNFGVYGITDSPAGYGIYGVNFVTSGTTAGVYGTTASPTGYGVQGSNGATSGNGVGVYGTGVYGVQGSGSANGLYGTGTGASSTGVYGTGQLFGVQGVAPGSGNTIGVNGTGATGVQGSGSANGIFGIGTAAGSIGVLGTAQQYGLQGIATGSSSTATGVYGSGPQYGLQGEATGTGGATVGVFGTGANGVQGNGTFYGVFGNATGQDSTGVYGTGTSYGLQGIATSTTNSTGVYGSGSLGVWGVGLEYGVFSQAAGGIAGSYGDYNDPSEVGQQGSFLLFQDILGGRCDPCSILAQAGVWADTNWNGDANVNYDYVPALLATADANLAAALINNSSDVPTLFAANESGGGTGDVIRAEGSHGTCSLTGGGDTACTGVLKSLVATAGGPDAPHVETYAVQSAENWFEDAGTAQLVNGSGRVNLESVFGKTVNTGVEYHVFLTPDGDCKGLYVSARSASGFEVRELGGGTSSVAFEYRIMAKRVGYENVRLAEARFAKPLIQSGRVPHQARPSAGPQPRPRTPLPPVQPVRRQLPGR
jgi:hypothetical protein